MVTASGSRRIMADHDILEGEPVLEGTRIPVRAIVLAWRSENHDAERVANRFPPLSKADVKAALHYFEANRKQIEEYIAENDLEGYIPEERPDLRCPPSQFT